MTTIGVATASSTATVATIATIATVITVAMIMVIIMVVTVIGVVAPSGVIIIGCGSAANCAPGKVRLSGAFPPEYRAMNDRTASAC